MKIQATVFAFLMSASFAFAAEGTGVSRDIRQGVSQTESRMENRVEAMSAKSDQEFVEDMIKHHEDGAKMAQKHLEEGARDPEITRMSEKIVKQEKAEIQKLQAWLKKNEGREKKAE